MDDQNQVENPSPEAPYGSQPSSLSRGWVPPGAGSEAPVPGAGGWVPPEPPGSLPAPDAGGDDLYHPYSGGDDPRPPRRPRSRWLAAGAATVVLLAAVGLGGYELGSGGSPQQETATQAIPTPASSPSTSTGSSGKLNVSALAAKVDPGVVDITATDGDSGSGGDAGTGMILTSNGEVLTNNHVVEGATSISAQIDGSGPKYTVKVLGTDATDDVALLQMEGASGLQTVEVGNSADVQVGDAVVAIGNALDLPGAPTVTSGIVSALNRSITASDDGGGSENLSGSENLTGLIQTDAPLASGNSGGPLVNSSGQVIAMNTAAASSSDDTSASNVGFAIPINTALAIASQIQKGDSSSTVEIGLPAFLGVDVENVSDYQGGGAFGGYSPPTNSGALVAGVVPSSAAAGAGISAGDVITSFGGKTVSSVASLTSAIDAYRPGASVTVGWVDSSGDSHSATVTLGTGPAA